MEITKARKLLGKEAVNMSDEQIKELNNQMDLLSNFMIDFIFEQVQKNKKEGETVNECLDRLNSIWKTTKSKP